jgi:ubiquinone/menaquinone biosynthesis C-methylase UbiE
MQPNQDKYSRIHVLDAKKLKKGRSRWNQFSSTIAGIDQKLLLGPMLDLGSGVGYFVLEGLQRGMNIWGVDASAGKLLRFQMLVQFTHSPDEWLRRCLLADADDLPFASNRFAAVSSWYVLEHQVNPASSLRELVRVTQPGGIIVIKAQDARNSWEGHCKIPWIPFLGGSFARAWAEEFGTTVERRAGVYDVTQPQVTAILEALGCTVAVQAPEPAVLIPRNWQISTEAEVRQIARRIKSMHESGRWQPQPENLYVYAIKK